MAYFSITFGDKNTWADWHLIPATPPMVNPPNPVTKYVDVPGRRNGPLDMTEWFGGPTYGSSSGSWEFISEYDGFSHDQLYEQVRRHLHNKSMFIKLEEDSSHYYKGRFSVSLPKTGKGPNTITINYVIEPVRYNLDKQTLDANYP